MFAMMDVLENQKRAVEARIRKVERKRRKVKRIADEVERISFAARRFDLRDHDMRLASLVHEFQDFIQMDDSEDDPFNPEHLTIDLLNVDGDDGEPFLRSL